VLLASDESGFLFLKYRITRKITIPTAKTPIIPETTPIITVLGENKSVRFLTDEFDRESRTKCMISDEIYSFTEKQNAKRKEKKNNICHFFIRLVGVYI